MTEEEQINKLKQHISKFYELEPDFKRDELSKLTRLELEQIIMILLDK